MWFVQRVVLYTASHLKGLKAPIRRDHIIKTPAHSRDYGNVGKCGGSPGTVLNLLALVESKLE